MIEQADCIKNILNRKTIRVLGFRTQFTQLAEYSAELLLSCTEISDLSQGVTYISQVDHLGMSIVFSRNRESPRREVLELSFSGGDRDTRHHTVLSEFESYLGRRQEQDGWFSFHTDQIELGQKVMHRWTVVVSD